MNHNSNEITSLSVKKALAGKRILLSGASGFVGKVWLAMLLTYLPEIEHVYLLLRRGNFPSVKDRLDYIYRSNPAFAELRAHYGISADRFFADRVTALEGDITKPFAGLTTHEKSQLQNVDLVVHSAGAVEFTPEFDEAIATNVFGVLNMADLAVELKARFIHVSTAFVAGNKQGRIEEKVATTVLPNGKTWDPEKELQIAQELILKVKDSQKNVLEQPKTKNKPLIKLGISQATRFGFPNTYTYVKALAEALLTLRYSELPKSIFRPSIVESAISFPFPGWNEGFNTSGPLVYLLGTWFRFFPSKEGLPFDVIPIDQLCRGLTTIAASLLNNTHPEVAHCGSSARNLFTVDRACELTGLAHRQYYRRSGKGFLKRAILSRFDTVQVEPNHVLSIKNIQNALHFSADLLDNVPFGTPVPIELQVRKVKKSVLRAARGMRPVEKVVRLFLPFVYELNQIFEGNELANIRVEEEEFQFAPESINWREYWVKIQVPGLRKWCFPEILGKKRPIYIPNKALFTRSA